MRLFAFFFAALCLAVDAGSKILALSALAGGKVVVVNSFTTLVLAYNRGAAFSFLAAQSGWQQGLFFALALAVSAYLLWQMARQALTTPVLLGYAAIVGGALGNAWNRVYYGHVIDFISWHYKGFYWPVFNLADCAIALGVVLVGLGWLKEGA